MSFRYRYSEWDGSQEIGPLDPDDILAGLTDDLMNFGDLQHALRNLLQRGMRNPFGQRMQGLRDILQQLRKQRRQTLDRYNLDSVFEDIKKRLEEIIDLEKGTLDSRLQKAERQLQGGDSPLQAFEEAAGAAIPRAEGVYATITGTLASLPADIRDQIAPLGYMADAPIPQPLIAAVTGLDEEGLSKLLAHCSRQSVLTIRER